MAHFEGTVPHHKDAIKRVRQTAKRNARNRDRRAAMRTDIKKVREAIEQKDLTAAEAGLREAASNLQRVVSKGIIHKKNASRRLSRLAQAVNALRG